MDTLNRYDQASLRTADSLRAVALSAPVRGRSHLSPEAVDLLVDTVAHALPAGEAPGNVLTGLASASEPRLPASVVRRDLHLLLAGLSATLDPAALAAHFNGPAALLWAYQNLLRLAGKDPESAFPQGAWQVYVDYALRDDTARQTLETRGFDQTLVEDRLRLSSADRLACWLMAVIQIIHQYPALLACEWRERVHTAVLQEVTAGTPAAAMGAKAYRDWLVQRPYARPGDVSGMDYSTYRRTYFESYLGELTRYLPLNLRSEWQRRIMEKEREELPSYLLQMTLLAYLEPGPYGETRMPLRLSEARVAVVLNGNYYWVPACAEKARTAESPPDPATVRAQAQAIFAAAGSAETGDSLQPLAELRRPALAALRARLDLANRVGLEGLRFAPVLINPMVQTSAVEAVPLARLRQAERGAGDHPMTIHDLGPATLFDQSAIFFDGPWGTALAEILTNEAQSWASYYARVPAARSARAGVGPLPPEPSALPRSFTPLFSPAERLLIQSAPKVSLEATAESHQLQLKSLLALRRRLKRRPDLANLTVNVLLLLYRAVHAATYWPSEPLLAELQALEKTAAAQAAAGAALDVVARVPVTRPLMVAPLDGGVRDPRERVYPLTLELPIHSIELMNLHRRTVAALDAYQQTQNSPAYQAFDDLQRRYLSLLAGFGLALARARQAALCGDLPALPPGKDPEAPLQRLLEEISDRSRLFRNRMRAGEIFSNIGQVSQTSTLTRYLAARDDHDQNRLVWGALSDAEENLHLTLRDFRPHVALLHASGRSALADRIAQEYLDAYVVGFNRFVNDLQRIAQSSKETRMINLSN